MATIEEIRKKFPEYNDVSDQKLADALHKKYYPDMPKNEFYSRIGLSTKITPFVPIKEKPVFKKVKKEFGFPERYPVEVTEKGYLYPGTQKGISEEQWEELKKKWPSYAGAIALTLMAPPGTRIPGYMALAGLGGMAGEAGKQLYEVAKGEELSFVEQLKRLGYAGAEQATYELAGQLAGKGIYKMLAPFEKTLIPEAREAMQALDKYMPKPKISQPISRFKKYKTTLLPAEATESMALDMVQNIAENAYLGGPWVARFKNVTRTKAIEAWLDDISGQFVKQADADTVASILVAAAEKRWKNIKQVVTAPLYSTAEKMAKGTRVSLRPLKELAKERENIIKFFQGMKGEQAGDNLLSWLLDTPDEVPFSIAKEMRSRFRTIADEISLTNKKDPAIGIAKELETKIDQQIQNALKVQNPEALQIWRGANARYKMGHDVFESYFMKSILSKGSIYKPGLTEDIMKTIFKKKGYSGIVNVKKAVGEEAWLNAKSWFYHDLLSRSVQTSTGELQGQLLINNLFGKSGIGQKAANAIFTRQELKQITDFGKTLALLQARQGAGTGRMFIQLAQAGALTGTAAGIWTGYFPPQAGVIVLTPALLSRALLNPTIAKYLTTGLKQFSQQEMGNIAGLLIRFTIGMKRAQGSMPKENP